MSWASRGNQVCLACCLLFLYFASKPVCASHPCETGFGAPHALSLQPGSYGSYHDCNKRERLLRPCGWPVSVGQQLRVRVGLVGRNKDCKRQQPARPAWRHARQAPSACACAGFQAAQCARVLLPWRHTSGCSSGGFCFATDPFLFRQLRGAKLRWTESTDGQRSKARSRRGLSAALPGARPEMRLTAQPSHRGLGRGGRCWVPVYWASAWGLTAGAARRCSAAPDLVCATVGARFAHGPIRLHSQHCALL